ncbi:MAG: hypothetical protein ABIQ35_13935, partial [Verrucomicrobiota bacterium]
MNRYEFISPVRQVPLAICFLFQIWNTSVAGNGNWPQFRGSGSSGISDEAAPVTWNVASGENIRWQTPIPGLAHASPIIWEDSLYLATVVKPGAKPQLKVGLYGDIGSYAESEPHRWRL